MFVDYLRTKFQYGYSSSLVIAMKPIRNFRSANIYSRYFPFYKNISLNKLAYFLPGWTTLHRKETQSKWHLTSSHIHGSYFVQPPSFLLPVS
jgi:hypothetical protein